LKKFSVVFNKEFNKLTMGLLKGYGHIIEEKEY